MPLYTKTCKWLLQRTVLVRDELQWIQVSLQKHMVQVSLLQVYVDTGEKCRTYEEGEISGWELWFGLCREENKKKLAETVIPSMCSPLREGKDGNLEVKKYQKGRIFVIFLCWQQCSEHMVCLRQGSYKLKERMMTMSCLQWENMCFQHCSVMNRDNYICKLYQSLLPPSTLEDRTRI